MAFPGRNEVLASRYRIEELLGEGTFGRVYLAVDIESDEKVAVKILKSDAATDQERILRFDREIKTLQRLDHPNILSYVDHGRQGDMIFLVVELLSGQSLNAAANDFIGQSERVLLLGSRLARAFGSAHAQGIIHRDIKPENIHVTDSGEPRILDYGLAGFDMQDGDDVESQATMARLTRTNEMMGTIPFMSPEQIRAERLDRRTDIFSLAVVLFELVAGRRPYVASTIPDLLEAMEAGDPPHISELQAHLTRPADIALDTVLRTALDPLAHQRFQTMEEFAQALDTALGSGTAIPADASPAILLPPRPTLAERNVHALLGRDDDFAALTGVLDRAASGGGAVVVVEAPAGMGKSLLVNELVRKAHVDGWLCLTSLLLPERTVRQLHPMGPWLERAADVFPEDDSVLSALDRLRRIEASEGGTLDDSAQTELNEAVLRALESLSQRMPLLLLLEDVHHATRSQLELLSQVARSAVERGGVLCLTRRSDAALDEHAASVLKNLLDESGVIRMVLAALSQDDLDRLVTDAYPGVRLPREVMPSFAERSGGNPFYAHAILKHLEEQELLLRDGAEWKLGEITSIPHPPEARELLENRLAGLEPGDLAILEAAAVLQREFSAERLSEVMQVDAEELQPRLRFLDVRQNILFREQNGYRFDQPLTKQILLQRLDPDRSRELHLRAARTLELLVDRSSDARIMGSVASHFMQAGRPAEAMPHLFRTGIRLRKDRAHKDAIGWLEQARDVIEQQIDKQEAAERKPMREKLVETELSLGESLQAVGRHGDALRHLESAKRMAASVERPDLKARSLMGMAEAYFARGDLLQAQRRAREAERSCRRASLDAELAMALSLQATATSRIGDDPEEAEEMWQEAAEILGGLGRDEDAAEIHFRLGNHHFRLDRYDEAESCHQKARAMIEEERHPQLHARIVNSMAAVDLARGRPEAALPKFEKAAETRRRIGAQRGEAATLHNIAYCQHLLGRLEDARATYERVIVMRSELDEPGTRSGSQRNLAEVLLDLGQIEEALRHATEALDVKRQLEDLVYVPNCLNMLGEIELQLGRTERARAEFSEVVTEFREGQEELIGALAGLGKTEALAGQTDEARQRFDLLDETIRESGASLEMIRSRYRLLEFLLADGADESRWSSIAEPFLTENPDDEGRLWTEALHLWLGRGLVAEARGDAAGASACLQSALSIASRLLLAEQAWRIHAMLARLVPDDSDARKRELQAARVVIDRQSASIKSEPLRTVYCSHPKRAAIVAATSASGDWKGVPADIDVDSAETLG